MWAFGVVDDVEPVDLLLQLLESVSDRLFVEPPEQRLMEPLVLTLRGRLVGLPRDRFDAEGTHVRDELPDDPTP